MISHKAALGDAQTPGPTESPWRKWLPTLAALIVCAGTFKLGLWQTDRAEKREASSAHASEMNRETPLTVTDTLLPAADVDQRKVSMTGHFLPGASVYLDNRQYQGHPGFHVLMPLQLSGGMAVLVNRGWMPVNAQGRAVIVPPATSTAEVAVEGVAVARLGNYWSLGADASGALGAIWPNFSLDAYAHASGLRLQPFEVLQTSASDDGLIRDWPAPGAGSERNRGYAVQWFSMSALAAGLWLWFGLKKLRR